MLAGVLAVLLITPAVVSAALPQRPAIDQVTLTAEGYKGPEIPVEREPGQPLNCKATTGSMSGNQYECPEAMIDMLLQTDYKDRDRALARGLRALSVAGLSAKDANGEGVIWHGDLGLFFAQGFDNPMVGIASPDPEAEVKDGEPTPLLVVSVTGEDAPEHAGLVWAALGGDALEFWREYQQWSQEDESIPGGQGGLSFHPQDIPRPVHQLPQEV